MRDVTRDFRVWADAICINQEDVTERNQQVSIMGRIYAAATHTIIYLWTSTMSTPRAFLDRDWFRRIWVFQEFVLSRDPWIQLGRSRIRWDRFFKDVSDSGKEDKWTWGNSYIESPGLDILQDMERTRSDVHSRSLLQLLQARRGMGAQDPRDITFAHLGIASTPKSPSSLHSGYPAVDYTRSLFEYLGAPGNTDLSPYIPSWVTDWRLPPSSHPRPTSGRQTPLDVRSNIKYPNVIQTELSAFLATAGYLLDTVKARGPVAAAESLVPPRQRRDYHENLAKLVEALHPPTAYSDRLNLPRSLGEVCFNVERSHAKHFDTFLKECLAWLETLPVKKSRHYFDGSDAALDGRRLVLTSSGYFAAVLPETQEGDICVSMAPFHGPLILRQTTIDLGLDRGDGHRPKSRSGHQQTTLKRFTRTPLRPFRQETPAAGTDNGQKTLPHVGGGFGMGMGMGFGPSIPSKRRKRPVEPADILHCKVVGKCRMHGFEPWADESSIMSRARDDLP
ncbi:hypothetical protein QBC34DRAFT_425214 [Podospora aff. communis PSN243]|uniref:Heterokaryon incompatibility domain-containing protein n=1 Tax=Podospora aff. communis PSN243 TaxID=3040156 RepID=A0AAV9GPD7_9PEZI|nr:hypothetical protein QBC34DRAFT_425214 [Podospora aff. communis PSN243]